MSELTTNPPQSLHYTLPALEWIKLTSRQDTPLFVRVSSIQVVQGFDFGKDDQFIPGHTGAQLSLRAAQWSDNIYCRETAAEVLGCILPHWIQPK